VTCTHPEIDLDEEPTKVLCEMAGVDEALALVLALA
jgi:hypothetical protein